MNNVESDNIIDIENILSKTKIFFEDFSQSRAVITNEYEFAMAMIGMNVPVIFLATGHESGMVDFVFK